MTKTNGLIQSQKEIFNFTNKLVLESFTFTNDNSDSYERERYKKVIQNAIHWCLVNGNNRLFGK